VSETTRDRRTRFGKLFNFANNGITIAGIVITTLSALLIVTFMIVELSGGLKHNPYIGLFAYVALPVVFSLGLIEIPLGMWFRRRRLIREGASDEEMSNYPRLDFNNPRLRRIGALVLGLTVINGIILGSTSFLAIEKMESVEFCGTTCHVVMQPEHTAYRNSPHSRVACVECHIGPGASWFVRSKIDGLRQVWHTALGDYSRPIHTPLKNLRPARETCEHCHWPTKHHGDKLRTFVHFDTDEHNTPSYTTLLVKTGGGMQATGQHGGIHWWHIYSDNRIRFLTGDKKKDEIIWVELTTPTGETRTYSRDQREAPEPALLDQEAHLMDCIDCHNRPTHLFRTPAKALDLEMEALPEIRNLPFFKKTALDALTANYTTREEGIESVARTTALFYERTYPDLWFTDQPLITQASEAASHAFGRNFFPEMNTDWQSHPNHIGHDDFDGCMRCHDGEMMTADEEHVIPMECDTCHVLLQYESPTPPDFEAYFSQ